jgi:hypothetical protein
LLQPLSDLIVNQISITVKLWWLLKCLDEQFWLVDEMKIQEYPNLTEMVL